MNKFIILFVLVFASCSKDYSKLSYLDNYKLEKDNSSRAPAKVNNNPDCFIDSYPIDIIKKEIVKMEKVWEKKTEIPSPYNKINLKPAETHYIKRFQKYIYHNDETLSCNSLPCILNIAYGDKNSEAGYRIYHWFLKMGSGISTLDDVPGYTRNSDNWKTKTLNDFLFTVEELKLMNLTSKIISPKYQNILVSTIHRFPNGTTPGVNVAGLYAGFRGARQKPHREIILTKQPISFNNYSKLIEGFFIHTIIHELTHALDFTYGKKGTFNDFSDADAWKNLSWKFGEKTVKKVKIVDGKEVEYEDTIMAWIPDESKSEGFMRSYQKTSPGEDFAEVGAYFVVSPDSLFKKSPKKHNVFKADFNLNTDFKEESVLNEYKNILSSHLKENIWEVVKNCTLQDSTINEKSSYVHLDSQFSYLNKSVINCIEVGIENRLVKNTDSFFNTNYYSCHLKSKLDQSITAVVGSKTSLIADALDQVNAYADIKEKWASMKTELANKCDPINIYIQNFNKLKTEEYYNEELLTCTEAILSQYGSNNTLFKELVDDYIKLHQYLKTKEKAREYFTNLTKGIQTAFKEDVKRLVNSCPVHFNEQLEGTIPVDGGVVFVNASVLNCINKNFLSEYDSSLKNFLDIKYHFSDESLFFISELYRDSFVQYINDELASISEVEYEKYVQPILHINSKAAKTVLNLKKAHKIVLFDSEPNKLNKELIAIIQSSIEKEWGILGFPLTISLNEISTQLYHILIEELIKVSKVKQKEEIQELNGVIATDARKLKKVLESNSHWADEELTQSNFKSICKKLSKNYLDELNYDSNSFELNTEESIKQSVEDIACNAHLDKFIKESNLLNNKIESLIKENTLYADFTWRVVSTKDEYISRCHDLYGDKISELTRESVFFKSSDISRNLLVKESCITSFKLWESVDLDEISKSINCSGTCNSVPSEFSNNKNAWLVYKEKFLNELIYSKESLYKDLYEKEVEKCNELYPNTRYAVMRMKKKKCIEEINLKNISFTDVKIHTKIAKMISEYFSKY